MIRITYLATSWGAKKAFLEWFKTCYKEAIAKFMVSSATDDCASIQYVFEAFVKESKIDIDAARRVVVGHRVDMVFFLPSSETELAEFRAEHGQYELR